MVTKPIKVSEWVYENLKARKVHPKQPFNEIIENMIKREGGFSGK